MATKMKNVGLINHLRHWGLKVEEKEGWRFRGRPYDFYPRAIIAHHTASGAQSGNFASETVVTFGRSDLPGPLCQVLLGRDGTVKMIAAGYANHAGYGGPRAGIPANTGNTYSIGIEAENNGLGEPWSKEQLNAYYRLCAALLVWMGTKDVSKVIGHKEWAPGRKIDPAGIDMNHFREQVRRALLRGPSVQTVHLSRLKPGKRNEDILKVKRRLKRRGIFYDEDKNLGKRWNKNFEKAWAEYKKSIGHKPEGPVGEVALRKLGFRVVE